MYTLIVLTFLAGNAWGPQVQMTPMPNAQACESARATAVAGLVKMSKSNMTGGGITEDKDGAETILVGPSGREIARLSCQNNVNPVKVAKASKLPTNEELRALSQLQ